MQIKKPLEFDTWFGSGLLFFAVQKEIVSEINKKSEPISNLENLVRIICVWCRWRGSNPHEFQSISLMRGETSVCCSAGSASPDFNPLPSCEGRLADCASALHLYIISIHSPHARGDQYVGAEKWDVQISIHSPHTRGDVT